MLSGLYCQWRKSWKAKLRTERFPTIIITVSIKQRRRHKAIEYSRQIIQDHRKRGKASTLTIPGVPKQAERRIFSTLRAKQFHIFFNLCPLLEIQSFSNFAWFLRPMSEELCQDKASIRCFGEAHWSVAMIETRINGLPQNTKWMEVFSLHNSSRVGRKNQAKFEEWLYFKKWP